MTQPAIPHYDGIEADTEVLKSATAKLNLEAEKREVHDGLMATTSSVEREGLLVQGRQLAIKQGASTTRVRGPDGVWREQSPRKLSEATLATRAKIREQLLDPQMPSKKQGELRAKLAATYEPERR